MKKLQNQRAFVDPLSIIAVVFLVITLTVTAITVNDPLKKQLISSYAKEKSNFQSYADSLIRQRERSGKCKGSGCVAEEVINNQSTQGNNSSAEKSAQTEAEQKIIDTYNKAKTGDLGALKDLRESNSSLADQVQKELDAKAVEVKPEEVKPPSDLTLNQAIGNKNGENAFVSAESQAAQKQLTSYLNEQKPKVDSPTIQQTQTTNNTSSTNADIPSNNTPIDLKPKYESQADCEKNTNPYSPEFKSCNKYSSQEENKKSVWESLADISNQFSEAINNSNSNGLEGLGTYGLGGGNSILPTLPESAINSNEGYKNYARGTITSGLAGLTTAELIATPLNIWGLAGGTLKNLPAAAAVYSSGTVAGLAPILSTATASYITLGAIDCGINGSESSWCQNAGNMAISTYTLDPVSFTQMFTQAGQVYVDSYAVFSNIRRIPPVSSDVILAELDSPNVIDGSFIDDVGQTIIPPQNNIANIVDDIPTITTTQNNLSVLNNNLNSSNLAVVNTAPETQMLFAPSTQSLLSQIIPNLKSGGGINLGQIANNISSNPNVQNSDANQYLNVVGDGGMGFPQNYNFTPPNEVSVALANWANQNGVNTGFIDVTINNALNNIAANAPIGNPFPTSLDTASSPTAVSIPPTNEIGVSPQSSGISEFTNTIINSLNNTFNPLANVFPENLVPTIYDVAMEGMPIATNVSPIINSALNIFNTYISQPITNVSNYLGINISSNAPLTPEVIKKSSEIYMPKVLKGVVKIMRANGGKLDSGTVRFEDGRVWSAYYDKTNPAYKALRDKGGEAAVDEMISSLDHHFRNNNSEMFFSPKERTSTADHIVYIDITNNRDSSIAKAAEFFRNDAISVINEVNNKYGITDGSTKIADYMFVYVGEETPVIFEIKKDSNTQNFIITQKVERNAIQGALGASAGPKLPQELTGEGFLPMLEYRGTTNADIVVPIKKGINLYVNVIKETDIRSILPEVDDGIIPTDTEVNAIVSSVGFDNAMTPQEILKLLTPEQRNLIGNEEIKIKLKESTAVKIEYELGEGVGVSVDASPYSGMKEKIKEIAGNNSNEEEGLNIIMDHVIDDVLKVAANNGGIVNKVAGDGAEIFLSKITPQTLRDLLDNSNSMNNHIDTARNGDYGPLAQETVAFLDIYFKDQVLVKVGAVPTKAFLIVHKSTNGYIPTEIITTNSTSPQMEQSKAYKKTNGADQKVVSLPADLIKDFTPEQLNEVGIKVTRDPLTGDVLLTDLPSLPSPPKNEININKFIENILITIKPDGLKLIPIEQVGLFDGVTKLNSSPKDTDFSNPLDNTTTQVLKIISYTTGSNAYFKTGPGLRIWQMMISAAALYMIDRDQINKFIREILTTPPAETFKKLGKMVQNNRDANVSTAPVDNGSTTNPLDKVEIFMQRDNETVRDTINEWGTTLLELGCGPSSAINTLHLLGIDINPQKIIDDFYWDPETHQTGTDAVLSSLQQNGVSNAVSYGLQNQITDANKIKDYTGILIYGGSASNSKEKRGHIAVITCNKGNCYSIDSYFSEGKPVQCTVQSSTSIQCGDYNYHVGETGGNPDVLFPVIGSDKNSILPPGSISVPSTTNNQDGETLNQVVKSDDKQVEEKNLFNNEVKYTSYVNEDNILYHVVNFDLNNVNMVVDSHSGLRTTTSNFLENNGLDIAINGDGWKKVYDKDDPSIFIGYQTGYSISDGQVNPLYGNNDQIMYLDNNKQMQFVNSPNQIPKDVKNAISFVNWLIEDGEISTQVTDRTQDYLNPRTALGITKDNQAFIIVTDGNEYQNGMLMKDLAQLMKDMGAVNAVMFDGGTNSTMVINGEGVVEKNCNDGGECQVANHLGFEIIP